MNKSNKLYYDLIIIGGGAMGMATAFYASKEAKRILVIDRFDYFLPNSGRLKSNSAGATRQFRVQYSEAYMAKLALQAKQYWEDLEAEYKVSLVSKVGSLWFGDRNVDSSEGQINKAMEVMDNLDIPYARVYNHELERDYGFSDLPEDWSGFFQKDGGTINVPATFNLFYQQALQSGNVSFQPNTQVQLVKPKGNSVQIETDQGIFEGEKVVIAAGPYTNDITKSLGFELDIIIWQMVSCYFKKRRASVNYPSWFSFGDAKPWFDPNLYYGFEEVNFSNPGFIRVAPAFALHKMRNPCDRTERPNDIDMHLTTQWVQKHMPGLDPEARFKSSCMAALPADGKKKMFVDFAPLTDGQKSIVLFTAGWAFKYTPLIGKICSDLALTGKTDFDIAPFKIPKKKEDKLLETDFDYGTKEVRRFPF